MEATKLTPLEEGRRKGKSPGRFGLSWYVSSGVFECWVSCTNTEAAALNECLQPAEVDGLFQLLLTNSEVQMGVFIRSAGEMF